MGPLRNPLPSGKLYNMAIEITSPFSRREIYRLNRVRFPASDLLFHRGVLYRAHNQGLGWPYRTPWWFQPAPLGSLPSTETGRFEMAIFETRFRRHFPSPKVYFFVNVGWIHYSNWIYTKSTCIMFWDVILMKHKKKKHATFSTTPPTIFDICSVCPLK